MVQVSISLCSNCFLCFSRQRGVSEQVSEQAGERRSAPGVRKKMGNSGEGVERKKSPAVNPKGFTEHH